MASKVTISRTLLADLLARAATSPEAEICGLLFGNDTRIDHAQSTPNVAPDPARHFEIDPAALFAALRAERAGGARIMGYWHSHPGGRAHPSATDASMAAGDGKLWLIVTGHDAATWRSVARGRFDPVELLLIDA
jgi:proteasome lid subunit RPN8/RPN11